MPKVGGRRVSHFKDLEKTQNTRVVRYRGISYDPEIKGKVPPTLKQLAHDFRVCMYPNTAMKLEDSRKLKLSAYVRSARYYGVSHLVAYHTYNHKNYVRFIKGSGPVLTFRIVNYCRAKDIHHHLQNSLPLIKDINSPLLVLNNFQMQAPIDLKSIAGMLQSMFPPLNMDKIQPKHIKRVLSFTYKPENNCLYFRNYRVKLTTHGIDKPITDLLERKEKIDFSQFKTFAEYLQAQSAVGARVEAGEKTKQAVKLYEVGPRMKLRFHRFDEKLDVAEMPEDEFMDEHQMEAEEGEQAYPVQPDYHQQQPKAEQEDIQ